MLYPVRGAPPSDSGTPHSTTFVVAPIKRISSGPDGGDGTAMKSLTIIEIRSSYKFKHDKFYNIERTCMRFKDNRFSVGWGAYTDGIFCNHSKAQFSRFLQVIYTITKTIRFKCRHSTPLRRFRQQLFDDITCNFSAAVAVGRLPLNGHTLTRYICHMQVLWRRWWCFTNKIGSSQHQSRHQT